MATANDIINEAKKLKNYKASYNSCVPNNWFYGYNVGGGTAWCAAYVCYIFNKAGASNLIPVKSANCGVLARGFYDKGQLVKSGYKAGDIVFFHWSNASSGSVPGVYTLDHVGIIISNNGDGSYTTIEGNTGNSAYGECLIRTRYGSQISCCGRPKYSNSSSKSNSNNNTNKKTSASFKPNVYYKVRTQKSGWLPEVKNLEDYAGIENQPITDVAIKVDKGTLWYQVHVKGGSWLGKITGYNIKDSQKGYAGNGKPIDLIKICYKTPEGETKKGIYKSAQYKVSPTNTSAFYDWQLDTDTNKGQDGYAGSLGTTIDKLYIHLV